MQCQLCGKEVDELFGLETSSKEVCIDCTAVTCNCCGDMISQDENLDTDKAPYPQDVGFGTCKKCGGDPEAEDYKKKLGWGMTMFYEARFPIIREKLTEENQTQWDVWSFQKKASFVAMQVEKGRMI